MRRSPVRVRVSAQGGRWQAACSILRFFVGTAACLFFVSVAAGCFAKDGGVWRASDPSAARVPITCSAFFDYMQCFFRLHAGEILICSACNRSCFLWPFVFSAGGVMVVPGIRCGKMQEARPFFSEEKKERAAGGRKKGQERIRAVRMDLFYTRCEWVPVAFHALHECLGGSEIEVHVEAYGQMVGVVGDEETD